MEQFIPFVINHWFLWSLLITLIALLIFVEMNAGGQSGRKISSQQAVQMMNREKAILVDLRDTTNFQDGHIVGAVNIPLKHIGEKENKIYKNKKRPVILICVQGQHAAKVCARLVKDGFEKVYFIKGGIAAWRSAGLPLVKKAAA